MDKNLITHRFSSSFATSYNKAAIVQKEMAHRLFSLVEQKVPLQYKRILELGYGTGFLTRLLLEKQKQCTLWLNDITEHQEPFSSSCDIRFLPGDAEVIPFPDNLDVLLSGAVIQWFDDIAAHFSKAAHALKPNGILAFSTFGPQNFIEIRQLTGVGLPYKSLDELTALLEPYFTVIHAEEYTTQLFFQSAGDVLRQIKNTGVNSLQKTVWTPGKHRRFTTQYQSLFSTDRGLPLTYHPMLCIAQKRQK